MTWEWATIVCVVFAVIVIDHTITTICKTYLAKKR